jgi:hypothetical protein
VIEAYERRRTLRRAARGPQYGDGMIGAVEEIQLKEEAKRKARIAMLKSR